MKSPKKPRNPENCIAIGYPVLWWGSCCCPTHRLVHIAVQVVRLVLLWQKIGERNDLVALLLRQQHGVARVLAATY